MDISLWTPAFFVENIELCKNHLNNEDIWYKIPSVNTNEIHKLKDKCLVRFCGMVQDMHNPEYFFEKCEILNETNNEKYFKFGKYCDAIDLLDTETIIYDSTKNITSERQTIVVISLPGENTWVQNLEKQIHYVASGECSSRSKIEKKRPLEDDKMDTTNYSNTSTNIENKKLCTEKKESSTSKVLSKTHYLNFPLCEEDGKCCLVKIYENAETLKLNDIVQIIGFLSLDPILTDHCYHNNDEDSVMEIQTHNPPPSLIPRIHCIAFQKLQNFNPLLKCLSLSSAGDIVNMKKELSILISQLLFGDELAMEYLICHLISSVYLRNNLLALGKFTLNIFNIPALKNPNYGKDLYEILELLLAKSHYLPMTLENMNSISFIPKKDYECNRLTSGLLQLSSNTHLVLDETKLQPGRLNDSGCRSLAALSDTIKYQKVTYNFNYYQMEYDCDIAFLILSEGKSFLPSDFHIPLIPDQQCVDTFPEIIEAAKHFLSPMLKNLRAYLLTVRHLKYEVPNDSMKMIQDEFVKMRQNSGITADDLHQLLVLTRLLCLSSGKLSLDKECWQKACTMEAERKRRINNHTSKNT